MTQNDSWGVELDCLSMTYVSRKVFGVDQ